MAVAADPVSNHVVGQEFDLKHRIKWERFQASETPNGT